MCNRYRVDLNHPDGRGLDYELYADDEAEATAAALAASPEGAYLERVVPMEIDVEPPVPPEPPLDARGAGESDADYAARAGAAHAAWQEEQKQAALERQAAREAAVVRNDGESEADWQARRRAARDGARNVPAADMPPLPVPEWPELTEVEAAVWEARKAAEEAKATADAEAKAAAEAAAPALEHTPVEPHDPTRAEARRRGRKGQKRRRIVMTRAGGSYHQ